MKKYICKLVVLLLIICPFRVLAEDITFNKETVTLEKCIDGDTATFKDSSGNSYKTRFLAIDTPETVHPTKGEQPYGKEASNYTCNKLKNAKKIVLEYDENSTKTDKYDRIIAWVFVDDELLQEDLVTKGYAKVAYLYGDYKYTTQLKEKEQIAKNKKLRIWSSNTNTNDTTSEETDELVEILKKIAKKLLKKIENML